MSGQVVEFTGSKPDFRYFYHNLISQLGSEDKGQDQTTLKAGLRQLTSALNLALG